MRDAGHRTPDAGRRTSDIGHRTSDGEKSKNNISTPQGGGHNNCKSLNNIARAYQEETGATGEAMAYRLLQRDIF